ncbi:MAG: hypothetical protein WCE64_01130, partial [Bacteroidales bacterium]
VNLMNQHLAHISLAGARKYDYPLTFTYHEPWWNNYWYINDHFARLSLALSSGRQLNDILVLEPTTSAWLYDSYVKNDKKVTEIGQAFQTFVTTLEKAQVGYDLGSENIIGELGSVKSGKLVVGKCSYSTVVIPPLMENLDMGTYKLLRRFVSNGGRLVAFSAPSLVDGAVSEGLNEFFSKQKEKIIVEHSLSPELINKYFSEEDLKFTDIRGGDLYHQRRTLSDGQLLFMVNSSIREPLSCEVTTKGADAAELNTLVGDISGYPCLQEGGNITFRVNLEPAGSLLLFISPKKPEGFTVSVATGNPEIIASDSPLKVTRTAENVVSLEFCDILVGGELTKDLNTYYAADKVYKYYGFKNGDPWNTSVQFRTRTVDRDTFGVNTGFAATYHFNVKGSFDYSGMKVVVERPELWSVSVNGTDVKAENGEWWLDRAFGIYPVGTLVRKGDNTITLNVSPMKVHAEIEPVYITGDFSVKPADKGWSIEEPVKLLAAGSWKDQGMPFYSWGVSYTRNYKIDKPEGKYLVDPGKWKGTIAEVTVNGRPGTPLAFPPYRSDISGLLRMGENTVEVKVIGSLKNLLGPHFNNPAPGMVSPWLWRNVKSYPGGKDYQLLDYGLMEDFSVVHSK